MGCIVNQVMRSGLSFCFDTDSLSLKDKRGMNWIFIGTDLTFGFVNFSHHVGGHIDANGLMESHAFSAYCTHLNVSLARHEKLIIIVGWDCTESRRLK